MMKRSIVTTAVGDCERAIARYRDSDGAPLIRAEYRDAVAPQPIQRFRRGVPIAVLRADADDRVERLELVQPMIRRRAARAVMSHLQHRHATDLAIQMRFRR